MYYHYVHICVCVCVCIWFEKGNKKWNKQQRHKAACEAIRRLQGHCSAAPSLSLGQAFELMPGYCQEGYGKPHSPVQLRTMGGRKPTRVAPSPIPTCWPPPSTQIGGG